MFARVISSVYGCLCLCMLAYAYVCLCVTVYVYVFCVCPCMSMCVCVSRSVCVCSVCLCMPLYASVRRNVCMFMSVCLTVWLRAHVYSCRSVHGSVSLHVSLTVRLYNDCPYVCVSVCLFYSIIFMYTYYILCMFPEFF